MPMLNIQKNKHVLCREVWSDKGLLIFRGILSSLHLMLSPLSNNLPDICLSSLCLSTFSDAENITAGVPAALEEVGSLFGHLWVL